MSEFELGAAGSEQRLSSCDCEMTEQTTQVTREGRTATGTLRSELIATKRVFGFAYSYLPGKAAHTGDGGMGRDELLALYEDGDELSFHSPGDGAVEDVTVLFVAGSWRERLLVRQGDFWAWAVAFALVEA